MLNESKRSNTNVKHNYVEHDRLDNNHLNLIIHMARPIKETPVLKGADAARFRKQMELSQKTRPSSEEFARMKKNYDLFHSKAKF